MKNTIMAAALFSLAIHLPAAAQLTLTDSFDYWEDQTTHNITVSGVTFQGAYTCANDQTLRCGNCGVGVGAATVDMAVAPGCDTVMLVFFLGWSGNHSVVSVDNLWQGTIGIFGSCDYDTILVSNAAAITADSLVEVRVRDTILGCNGDIQMARLDVYSSAPATVGIPLQEDERGSLLCHPDPQSNLLRLEWVTTDPDQALTLYDMAGRVVFSDSWQQGPGPVKKSIGLSLSNGFYHARLISGKAKRTGHFYWLKE